MTATARWLAAGAALMALLALVPGLPFIPFVIGAGLLGAGAWYSRKAKIAAAEKAKRGPAKPLRRIPFD